MKYGFSEYVNASWKLALLSDCFSRRDWRQFGVCPLAELNLVFTVSHSEGNRELGRCQSFAD